MLEEAEQRPMNNEYVTLAGIFKFHSKFLSALQTRNYEVNRHMLQCPIFL